ncbi:magnesium transporter MgtC [bacterium DOLJORAL78_65_58]|nr:MAG: magnesium transporter MgtC [bacterium DOLZORAL124_64_63]PIE76518.1 MAG: magnesium transporter MgtC [bacterium DOLJORAL78_65_58]
MEQILEAVRNDGVFVMRLLLAMVLGGLVGLERQRRGRPAGLRTNILVCLGSAAIIVAFQKLSLESTAGAESAIRMDPARAAAGVITGIGFLGAGTIMKSRSYVRGLTTAASIWVVSAIGVTAGLGEYVIAGVLTLLVLLALYAFHRLSLHGDRYFSLTLHWSGDLDLLADVTAQLREDGVVVKNRQVTRHPQTGECEVELGLKRHKEGDGRAVLDRLQADRRFEKVSWG